MAFESFTMTFESAGCLHQLPLVKAQYLCKGDGKTEVLEVPGNFKETVPHRHIRTDARRSSGRLSQYTQAVHNFKAGKIPARTRGSEHRVLPLTNMSRSGWLIQMLTLLLFIFLWYFRIPAVCLFVCLF